MSPTTQRIPTDEKGPVVTTAKLTDAEYKQYKKQIEALVDLMSSGFKGRSTNEQSKVAMQVENLKLPENVVRFVILEHLENLFTEGYYVDPSSEHYNTTDISGLRRYFRITDDEIREAADNAYTFFVLTRSDDYLRMALDLARYYNLGEEKEHRVAIRLLESLLITVEDYYFKDDGSPFWKNNPLNNIIMETGLSRAEIESAVHSAIINLFRSNSNEDFCIEVSARIVNWAMGQGLDTNDKIMLEIMHVYKLREQLDASLQELRGLINRAETLWLRR